MMKTERCELCQLLTRLALAFGVPWLLLVLVPFLRLSGIEPSKEAAQAGLDYGPGRAIQAAHGERIYAREGCAYCHTQMVRPTYLGTDVWRPGWGGDEAANRARETRPEDYLGESYAHLGYMRVGPDLSNFGVRAKSRAAVHKMLYAPSQVFQPLENASEQTVMPPAKNLYRLERVKGQLSDLRVDAEGVPEGYQVLPTEEAEALVDYLLSRRKDRPMTAPKEEAAPAAAAGEVAAP